MIIIVLPTCTRSGRGQRGESSDESSDTVDVSSSEYSISSDSESEEENLTSQKTSSDGGERRKRCGKTEVFEDDDVMIILRYTRAFLPPFFIFLRRSVDGKN